MYIHIFYYRQCRQFGHKWVKSRVGKFFTMVTTIMGKSFRGNTLIREGLRLKFFGVGRKTADEVCSKLGFYPQMRMHQLDEPKVMALTTELSSLKLESELRNEVLNNIKMKIDIGCYQGIRHSQGLPVHGQRTRTNAKTAKKLNRPDRRI